MPPLQRGSYGIEYDERNGSPLRKLWLPAALTLVAAGSLLFFRGCEEGPAADALPEEGTTFEHRHQNVPGVTVEREKPSLFRHFLKSWRAPAGEKGAAAAAAAAPDPESGWRSSKAAPKAAAKTRAPEVKKLLNQVAAREEEGDRVGARQLLRQVLVRPDADDVRAFVERKIGSLNTAMVFSDLPMPEKARHRIASGDLIGKLAKQYGCTQEYLLKANGIDKPELLRIGREIWVLDQPVFELTVFKQSNSAVLTLNGQFFKRYEVGTGKSADVPDGTYAVRSKVKKPAYRPPGGAEVAFGHPQNLLGTRWVALSATGETPEANGLGLHGTWNESTLGRPSDAGRIRFRNADIEELCTLLPDGTLVNITE